MRQAQVLFALKLSCRPKLFLHLISLKNTKPAYEEGWLKKKKPTFFKQMIFIHLHLVRIHWAIKLHVGSLFDDDLSLQSHWVSEKESIKCDKYFKFLTLAVFDKIQLEKFKSKQGAVCLRNLCGRVKLLKHKINFEQP